MNAASSVTLIKIFLQQSHLNSFTRFPVSLVYLKDGEWTGRWPPNWRKLFPCLRQLEQMLFLSPALTGVCRLFPALTGVCRLFPALTGVCRRFPALTGVCRLFPALTGVCRLFPTPDQLLSLISERLLVVSLIFTTTLGMTTRTPQPSNEL